MSVTKFLRELLKEKQFVFWFTVSEYSEICPHPWAEHCGREHMGGMLGFFVLFCLVFYLMVDRKQGTKKCMMYAFVGEILPRV